MGTPIFLLLRLVPLIMLLRIKNIRFLKPGMGGTEGYLNFDDQVGGGARSVFGGQGLSF